jgi:thiosulfate dehydrogenase
MEANTMKATILMMLSLLLCSTAFDIQAADDSASSLPEQYQQASVKTGAQVYDNWPKLNGTKLETNQPLYPASSSQKGIDTWRCQECHGWDYIGKRGSYQSGPHATGIGGVAGNRNTPVNKIFTAIEGKGGKHNFGDYLNEEQLWAVTKFIREGIYNASQIIDGKGMARGHVNEGKILYKGHCAKCHGDDGRNYDVDEADGIQGIGSIALANPQKTMHKILWGNPGSNMPSLIMDEGEDIGEAVNILSYTQSLK